VSVAIEHAYLDQMIDHAREDVPNECCGVLLGREGRVTLLRRCTNAEQSPFRYSVAPKELLAIDRLAREHDWDVFAIYHSHTHTEAYPSPTDVRLAAYPDAIYILVSLQDADHPVVRAFNIRDGVITEDAIESVAGGAASGL
jgi:[CysO sulfur-carrier protein]-S-L-cysteine hydrolase